jgi:DNA excision repair protein ERCC-4
MQEIALSLGPPPPGGRGLRGGGSGIFILAQTSGTRKVALILLSIIIMKIRMDYREKASGLMDLLQQTELILEIGQVRYGDYSINDAITIERKTARDFLISIIDGRLFKQLSNLKKHCSRPLLLIEGNPYETDLDFDPLAIQGALLSTQAIWYIPVIFSHSKEKTRDIFLMLGRQEESNRDVVPLRGGYRPKRLKSRQLYLIQGLPQVGPTLAKRLLEHFGSVAKIVNAPLPELMDVEGIGRVSAKAIRAILDEDHKISSPPRGGRGTSS